MDANPKVFPKTSLPSVADYGRAMYEYVEKGIDVICVCLTSKFSGSYNSAVNARELLLEQYPQAKIAVVDSTVATVLEGLVVLEAAKMRDAGYSFERTVEAEISSFVPDGPEEGEYKIVRTKTFPIKPMTQEEAILQMNLLGHSFFAFKNEDAGGAFAVVYRRNDGDYGIIEDET